MASLLLGKKTPCTKDMMPSIPSKMTGPSSNKLIVVRVAIVESPAVNRLTVLFRMRNKNKGGAANNNCQIRSADKQEAMRSRAHLVYLIIGSAGAVIGSVVGFPSSTSSHPLIVATQ